MEINGDYPSENKQYVVCPLYVGIFSPPEPDNFYFNAHSPNNNLLYRKGYITMKIIPP